MTEAKPKVLYVEDDRFFTQMLAQRLTDAGYAVSVAADGEQGLAILQQERDYSAVLLDLMMPGMDGYEVLQTIRADKTFERMPIIVLSNVSAQEANDRATTLGATSFLVKALTTPTLIVEEVNRVLGRPSGASAATG
jgi:CheY-like chemotaxis protein